MDGKAQTNDCKACGEQAMPFPLKWRNCLGRICSWRVPPNWGKADWIEEISAVAASAAQEAGLVFDPSRGVPLAALVSSRVLARALTRYRQEWRFALCCICSNFQDDKEGGAGSCGLDFFNPAGHEEHACDAMLEALASLDEPKRFVIEQIFWRERTEAEIGQELGISQRAVSKRKISALRTLRERLQSIQEKKRTTLVLKCKL